MQARLYTIRHTVLRSIDIQHKARQQLAVIDFDGLRRHHATYQCIFLRFQKPPQQPIVESDRNFARLSRSYNVRSEAVRNRSKTVLDDRMRSFSSIFVGNSQNKPQSRPKKSANNRLIDLLRQNKCNATCVMHHMPFKLCSGSVEVGKFARWTLVVALGLLDNICDHCFKEICKFEATFLFVCRDPQQTLQ